MSWAYLCYFDDNDAHMRELLSEARHHCCNEQLQRLRRGCLDFTVETELVAVDVVCDTRAVSMVLCVRSHSFRNVTYVVTVTTDCPQGCTCTCPDQASGSLLCKHICFVLVQVLRMKEPWLVFQEGNMVHSAQLTFGFELLSGRGGECRNAGEPCAICYDECRGVGRDGRPVLFCAHCQNGMHWQCALRWFLSNHLSCPLCRAEPLFEDTHPQDADDALPLVELARRIALRDVTNSQRPHSAPTRRLPSSFYNLRPRRRIQPAGMP
jgi:hypothetical protein